MRGRSDLEDKIVADSFLVSYAREHEAGVFVSFVCFMVVAFTKLKRLVSQEIDDVQRVRWSFYTQSLLASSDCMGDTWQNIGARA